MGLPHYTPTPSHDIEEVIYKALYTVNFKLPYSLSKKKIVEYLNDNCIRYRDTKNYIDLVFNLNWNVTYPENSIMYTDIINAFSKECTIEINLLNKLQEVIHTRHLTNLLLDDYSFSQDWSETNEICYLYIKLSKENTRKSLLKS